MSSSIVLHETLGLLAVSTIAIASMLLAEVLSRTTNVAREITRKIAHVGSGIGVLAIPVFIDSAITVLVLCVTFALLMIGTNKLGLLQGMHGVGRGLGGVLWYPTTAFVLFALVYNVMHAPDY